MKHIFLNILFFWLASLPSTLGQNQIDSFYEVGVFNLTLVSPDSNYNHQYECPRISGLNNKDLQLDINRFLKSQFFPSRQEIRDFKSEFEVISADEALMPSWDYLESTFQVNLKTLELLMVERNYIHEFDGMSTARWGAQMFAIDMTSGEWIEHLYEFIDAKKNKEFNQLLNTNNTDFQESGIFVDISRHKDFSIFENKDRELWLVLYIPPFGEYMVNENGKLVTYSNGYEPMRFEIPLKLFNHLVVDDSVLKKVIHKRAQ